MEKKNKAVGGLIESDLRRKHDKHATVDKSIRAKIKEHIDSTKMIESHYTRAKSSRTYIDGSKSIADIHNDYIAKCKKENLPFGNYSLLYKILI